MTPTATPAIQVIADNSAGTGNVASTTILGTVEPAGTGVAGRFLISVVAIQGTGAASATISLPTAPAAWTSIGDWACGSSGNAVQVAAAYRITDASDAPGNNFTWTFSNSFFASVVNTVYSGVNTSIPIDVMEQSPSCNPGSAGSLIVVPAITTTVNNDLLVAVFAAAGTNNSVTLANGSPLSPVADQNNSGFGPADFNAFGMTYVLGSGAPGSYGPYTATQGASGESLGVMISVKP